MKTNLFKAVSLLKAPITQFTEKFVEVIFPIMVTQTGFVAWDVRALAVGLSSNSFLGG